MYKCVIFDFDGTIASTENLAVQVANSLADIYKFKKISIDELPMLKKMGAMEVFKYLGVPKWKLPLIIKKCQKISYESMAEVDLCHNGLREVLYRLKENNKTIGLITSNSKKNVWHFLKKEDIDVFDFMMTSSVFGKDKKIKMIMTAHGLKEKEVLYVGDEIRDIEGAKKANIFSAAVTWGYNDKESLKSRQPDWLIDTVEDLEKACLHTE